MADKEMSFLPEDYVERRIERRTSLVCLAMFVVVLGGVGAVYAYKNGQLSEAKARRDGINASYAEAARRLEQLEALQLQRNEMLRKAQVSALLLERVPRTFLLADLVNRMPEPLSLLELTVNTKVVQAPRPSPTKTALANKTAAAKDAKAAPAEEPLPQQIVTLSLTGVAPTDGQVAQYMSKLTESPLLSDVNMVYTEETKVGETAMRKFRFEMTLSPTADVRALDPAQRKLDRPRNPIKAPEGPGQVTGLRLGASSDK